MLTALLPLLSIAAEVIPLITDSAKIGKIVDAVTTLTPAAIRAVEGGAEAVKNIVTALRSNDDISDEDWDRLDVYEAKIDADWDAAKEAAVASE